MKNKIARFLLMITAIAMLAIVSLPATPAGQEFQITSPRANAVVPGEVIECSGTGADPAGTIEVAVMTNAWYTQTGKANVNPDGTWTYSPIYLSGQGQYSSHTIKATIIKGGSRGKSATVGGIVRK